ncbi:MAG TPA: phosphatidylserine/phosphatidylglycerophosphate/cardiolipin synthase family protein [Verrucomicrobiae bacterium]|nr:phosphatidylserine/phosphatidylglycerophosphate/cardiolipin synthase family protein [Verrucomicrobiae bacterium]
MCLTRAGTRHWRKPAGRLGFALILLCWVLGPPAEAWASSRQRSADVWRRLTETNTPPPEVFVRGNEVRFYFPAKAHDIGFVAKVGSARLPTAGYQVSSALLRLKKKLPPVTSGKEDWVQPVLIAGVEWRRLSANLMAALTPATPGHAKYYRGLLGDRILYRNEFDRPAVAPISQPPARVVIDHRYSIEESLQTMATLVEPLLKRAHPQNSLFVLMIHSGHSAQPLLIDTKRHRCVWISSAALYEPMEPGLPFAPTLEGFSALALEGTGLALVKNPVSSIARLGNLVVQALSGLVRLPFSKPSGPAPPLVPREGMNLDQWEDWLDEHTSSRREYGSIRPLIDGERFFPRFQQAVSNATDHVRVHVFIFDNDDFAVQIANELKQRSRQAHLEVITDRLATMAAGRIPPVTPPAGPYTPPHSITRYLKEGSQVQARPFLNAFCSYDHSKVYLVDGASAWMGGMNIGREYRSEWHDMMVELQGPIVRTLEYEFQLDWAHASWLGDLAYLKTLLSVPKPPALDSTNSSWIQMRLLPTTTLRKSFAKAVLHSLQNARSYIYVENPYLFDKRVMSGLVRARERGVDVRVILPHANDSRYGARAELVGANYLVSNGVRVFYYPGMSHLKALLVDGWACVGSGNLNQFSFGICQERNVATSDPVFTAKLKRDLFEQDFTRCYELTQPVPVEWRDFVADFVLEGI